MRCANFFFLIKNQHQLVNSCKLEVLALYAMMPMEIKELCTKIKIVFNRLHRLTN